MDFYLPKPNGSLAVPLWEFPGLVCRCIFTLVWLFAIPSGLVTVEARGPEAPVASLMLFPYSRMPLPQSRDELVMLHTNQ
jgi:hypothetical protein